jgi:hypothetical protein
MSSFYAISRGVGTNSYDSYISSLIIGPLNSSKYPSAMPSHTKGTLNGTRPTPPQFFPMQQPIYSTQNTNRRQQYIRALALSKLAKAKQTELAKSSTPTMYYNQRTGIRRPVSTHVNYIAPTPASAQIEILKSNAIGKSALKIGVPIEEPLSTKNYTPSTTRASLRRARSGGSAAPKKKTSIYNQSTAATPYRLGSLPRATY